MTNERKDEILNGLIDWICEQGKDYIVAAFGDLSPEEIEEFGLQDWFD